ncbi:LuxR C-terminal-related transcriptional regulator [Fictibacillus aquaticus]|nr:response regulator transcription factor [Fictibacillus aquaticus]
MINILLIDDEIIFKDSLQYLLFQEINNLSVTSIESHSNHPLYKETEDIDIAFVDIGLKHDKLTDVLQHFQERRIRTVLFVSCINQQKTQLLEALTFKVDGVLLKNTEPESIRSQVKLLLNGKRFMPQSVAFLLLEEYAALNEPATAAKPPLTLLSNREWEVLENLSKGMSNREISLSLFLSENTVKNHVSTLLKKLGVKDRTSAVITAYQQGWTLVHKS